MEINSCGIYKWIKKNVGFGLESINLSMEARLPPRVNYMVCNLYLNKAAKKKTHFLLIIHSNNLWRKLSKKDLASHVTNAKHLLLSLNKNQDHKNGSRGP